MAEWFQRSRLICPGCGYDVAQTLEDGFPICPECGGPIDPETCAREIEQIPRWMRRLVYTTWIVPIAAALPVALAPNLWPLLAAGVVGVYAGWVAVHRWLNERGAWHKAIVPTIAILILQTVALCAVLIVLSVLGFFVALIVSAGG